MRSLNDRHTAAPIAPLKVKDLTTAAGLTRAAKSLNASPEDMVRFYAYSKGYIEEDPRLGDISIGKSSGGDFYDIDKNRIALSSSDPDVYAHEMGHAERLHDSSGFYKGVLKGSKAVSSMLNLGSIPIGGAVTYTEGLTSNTKKNILRGLASASALAALPNLVEEVGATANALGKSNEALRSLRKLAPGLASHSFHGLSGPATYYLFSKLNKERRGQND